MTLLIAGIIVFFAVHLLPSTTARGALVTRLGENGYKGLFSLGAFAGLLLIIFGFRAAEFTPLWAPLPAGRGLAMSLMPIAAILVIASNMPNNLKRFVRHPMLIGIALWGSLHLAANGDLASTIIFASFLGFSILNIALVEAGGRYKAPEPVSYLWDLGTVVAGIALFLALFFLHPHIAGVPIVQMS